LPVVRVHLTEKSDLALQSSCAQAMNGVSQQALLYPAAMSLVKFLRVGRDKKFFFKIKRVGQFGLPFFLLKI
jgi:hypothetical protein